MLERMRSAMVSEDGSLNLEMALIIALLILVAVGTLSFIAAGVNNQYGKAGNKVSA